MGYTIQQYTYDKAKQLELKVLPANDKRYKIDVFNKYGNLLNTIGNKNFYDYPTYLNLENMGVVEKGYADRKRNKFMLANYKWKDMPFSSKNYLTYHLLW